MMIARIFNQKYKLLVLSSIILLGGLIYSNTFYGYFHFDDNHSILDNFAITNILNLPAIWNFWPSRFITYLSIALNYHLSQLNVLSYHIFNLIVHLGSGILVWWLMLLTFSTSAMQGQKITQHAKLLAFFAGLIFIAHPIQTQGVTYIIQRAVSLATLFYLLSLSLYVKSRLLQQQGGSLIVFRRFYHGALIAAVCAMFTKEMAITLPLMILLYEFCFLKTKEKLNWKQFTPFLLTLLIIPLTMFLTKSVDFIGMKMTRGTSPNISPGQYLLTQFRVMVTYIRLIFIPINQNLDYDYPLASNLLALPILASLTFLASILTISMRIFSKYRLIAFGIFWFFLTLIPESSVIPIKDVIFEHRLYLPMVGFSFFLVSLIDYLFGNKTLKSMVVMLLIITTCYAVLTYRRNLIWKDEFTLWNDVVHKSPKKARPYNSRGNAHEDQSGPQKALFDYNKAIEIDPNYAEAYNNRGGVYYQQGNFTQAAADFNKAIAIKPNFEKAYYNRGVGYYEQNNFTQAIVEYNRAIEINSNFEKAYYNRGGVYYQQGNFTQAISDYTKAIEINPNFEKVYYNRGIVYYFLKEYDQAWKDVHRAEELGSVVNIKFLEALKKASGRDK